MQRKLAKPSAHQPVSRAKICEPASKWWSNRFLTLWRHHRAVGTQQSLDRCNQSSLINLGDAPLFPVVSQSHNRGSGTNSMRLSQSVSKILKAKESGPIRLLKYPLSVFKKFCNMRLWVNFARIWTWQAGRYLELLIFGFHPLIPSFVWMFTSKTFIETHMTMPETFAIWFYIQPELIHSVLHI